MNIVNHSEYHKLREAIGSQAKVAGLLGINIRTLQRREAESLALRPALIKPRCLSHVDNLLRLCQGSSSILRSSVKGLAELLA